MTKQEFLDGLRAALSGRVSTGTVMENISFYEEYINTQVRMGKSEAEVLQKLGDPRLLARSIVEAEKRAGTGREQEAEYGASGRSRDYEQRRQGTYDYGQGQRGAYEYRYETGRQNGYGAGQRNGRVPVWLVVCLVLLFVVLILSFVFSVLSFLAPILIPILLITLTIRLFRRLL